MTPLDRYIDRVLARVFASESERERLEADLRSHWAAAEERGEPASRIVEELGNPEDVAAAFNAERPFVYAGFWERLVAFIADVGVLLFFVLPALGVAVLSQSYVTSSDEIGPGWIAALVLLMVAAVGTWIFYFPILEARFGKTAGKHLLKLRVVRENGAPIGLGQAFVRRLSLYFELLAPDALFIPFTDRKQRALDIVAKTVVAREPGASVSVVAWLLCLLLPALALCAMAGIALLCAPV